MLTLTIGFALYYLMVGTLVWFIEVGRGAVSGEFERASPLLIVCVSLWVIVAWPEVLRLKARDIWAREPRS